MEDLYASQSHDRDRIGVVLNEAFQDDPVFNAIFEGATSEQRIAFYTIPVVYCMKYGQVIAPSKQLEGIAAWVTGKYADMSMFHMLLSGALWSAMRMGAKYSQRMATVFKPVDEDRKANMQGRDYIYLVMIGIAPQHQGKGLGGKLMQALLAESERSGLPIYLETETEENVSLYQHYGFEVINKVNLPLIDLPMWEMLREPAG